MGHCLTKEEPKEVPSNSDDISLSSYKRRQTNAPVVAQPKPLSPEETGSPPGAPPPDEQRPEASDNEEKKPDDLLASGSDQPVVENKTEKPEEGEGKDEGKKEEEEEEPKKVHEEDEEEKNELPKEAEQEPEKPLEASPEESHELNPVPLDGTQLQGTISLEHVKLESEHRTLHDPEVASTDDPVVTTPDFSRENSTEDVGGHGVTIVIDGVPASEGSPPKKKGPPPKPKPKASLTKSEDEEETIEQKLMKQQAAMLAAAAAAKRISAMPELERKDSIAGDVTSTTTSEDRSVGEEGLRPKGSMSPITRSRQRMSKNIAQEALKLSKFKTRLGDDEVSGDEESRNSVGDEPLEEEEEEQGVVKEAAGHGQIGKTGHGLGSAVQTMTKEEAEAAVTKAWRAIESEPAEKPSFGENVPRRDWKLVRVFVSSTFTDFFSEREVLVKKTFPALRAWAETQRIKIVEVDLRWGVPKESTSESVFRACLGELDRCREENVQPFFINLLGQRYGWVPTHSDVPPSLAKEYSWVFNTSITHMEVLHGAWRLRNPNAVFFIRDSTFLSNLPSEFEPNFVDSSPLHVEGMARLKSKLRSSFPKQVRDYTCAVDRVDASSGLKKVILKGLDKFSDDAFEFLKAAISRQYPLDDAPLGEDERLRVPHDDLRVAKTHLVVGRDKDVQSLVSTDERRVVVAVGGVGEGKCTLACAVAEKAKALGHGVFFHSFSLGGKDYEDETLSRRLVLEAYPEPIKESEDANEYHSNIRAALGKLFSEPSPLKKKPFFVIVDAAQDGVSTEGLEVLGWIPKQLPEGLRVIVTAERGHVVDYLEKNLEAKVLEMTPLTRPQRQIVAESTLALFNKKLDPDQMNSLLANEGSTNLLWLSLACEELRVFGVFETVSKRIKELEPSVEGLSRQLLSRIHSTDDLGLFKKAMISLCISRGGLLEDELLTLLGSVNDAREVEPLAMALWSPLFAMMKPFIRLNGGERRLAARSRVLSSMVLSFYAETSENVGSLVFIKTHFKSYAHALANLFETANEDRKVEEYPFAVMAADDKPRLVKFLRSAQFNRLRFQEKRMIINDLRCKMMIQLKIPMQAPKPERMCMGCSMKYTFSTRFFNKMACALCGEPVHCNTTAVQGAPFKASMGEKAVYKCRQHNGKAYMPGPVTPCGVCGVMIDPKFTLPMAQCRYCASNFHDICCHLG